MNKLLLVMEKFCEGKPDYGPAITDWLVDGAIRSTGLVERIKVFRFDEMSTKLSHWEMERLLLETCQVFQPDLVIFARSASQPGPAVMRFIADELHIKILNWFPDAKPFSNFKVDAFPWCTHVGTTDMIAAYQAHKHFGNVILMYCATDPAIFRNTHHARTIDVSFLGSIDPTDRALPMRTEYLGYLSRQGIALVVSGGQRRATKLHIEEYSKILNQSKMTINFSRDGDHLPLLKTRVFEAMSCNTLLLEDAGSEAGLLFRPGKEYVEYSTKEDLEKKVRYYLAHEDERRIIAQAGNDRVTSIFNARNMWGHVFEQMGFSIPADLASDQRYQEHKKIMEGF